MRMKVWKKHKKISKIKFNNNYLNIKNKIKLNKLLLSKEVKIFNKIIRLKWEQNNTIYKL